MRLNSLAPRSFRNNLSRNAHPNSHTFLRAVAPSLVATSYVPASVRRYAQTPPGGTGGGGGIPGFRFPMQQEYLKGDALKEFVRDNGAFGDYHN